MDKCLEAQRNGDASEADVNGNSIEKSNDVKEAENYTLSNSTTAKSEIQKFYKDQCIFLTGGTGFLGKALIEKLLRSCGDIDTIYVLVRSKKGQHSTTRIQNLLDDLLFQEAHKVNPKGKYKVVPIVGDTSLPGIGLSDEDRQLLISRVTIIIHGAATVKFDEKLSTATVINVTGTKEVIKLAKECKKLIAFTHVSTAFSNTHVDHIEEKVYEPPMSAESLEALSLLDDKVIEDILPSLLGRRPNTYCFTKAVAEDAVIRHGEGLPLCIFRPSIVVSTYKEPLPGWTDSLYGPGGIVAGVGTGVLRTLLIDGKSVGDIVPVDLTVNAMIVSTYHTAKNFNENQTSAPVYNFVSGPRNPITWREYIDLSTKYGVQNPPIRPVWYIGLNETTNYYVFLFYDFFLHYLPALLIDAFCALTGKKRFILKLYYRVNKLANVLIYFMTQHWKFNDYNVRDMWSSISEQDKAVFPFDIEEVCWDTCSRTWWLGIRTYIFKEDISTIPEAKKKWNRLFYIHQLLKIITFSLVLYLGYFLLKITFSFVQG